MQSDRWHPGWAVQFAQDYFRLSDAAVMALYGTVGKRLMSALWDTMGTALYHDPRYAVRQEIFQTMTPLRSCPLFFQSLPSHATVLDVGAGTAELERRQWIDRGGRTILMDLPGPNQRYTAAKYQDCAVTLTDRIPQSRVEGLICVDVLEHLVDPMAFLEASWACLKPGGRALLWFDGSLPHPGHLPEAVAQRPLYDKWLLTHTNVIWQGVVDFVEKPKRWWSFAA